MCKKKSKYREWNAQTFPYENEHHWRALKGTSSCSSKSPTNQTNVALQLRVYVFIVNTLFDVMISTFLNSTDKLNFSKTTLFSTPRLGILD